MGGRSADAPFSLYFVGDKRYEMQTLTKSRNCRLIASKSKLFNSVITVEQTHVDISYVTSKRGRRQLLSQNYGRSMLGESHLSGS